MVRSNWNGIDSRVHGESRKGGKLSMLVLAGLAAVAWANRDKILAGIETLRTSGTSAASAGSGSRFDDGGGFGAHRADGSDDSASFGAGIADEGSIPNAARY